MKKTKTIELSYKGIGDLCAWVDQNKSSIANQKFTLLIGVVKDDRITACGCGNAYDMAGIIEHFIAQGNMAFERANNE